MSKKSIHPPGKKIQKAMGKFTELLANKPLADRQQLLQKVAIKFDLSPKECDFLNRHFGPKTTVTVDQKKKPVNCPINYSS